MDEWCPFMATRVCLCGPGDASCYRYPWYDRGGYGPVFRANLLKLDQRIPGFAAKLGDYFG